MKIRLSLSILLLILITVFSVKPLYSEPYTQPFSEYENICWQDETAHLDNFAFQLQTAPATTVGHILVAAGRSSCVDEAKYRGKRAKDWVVKRGTPANRVVVRNVGYQKQVWTQLWLVPSGATAPGVPSQLNKTEVSIHKCVDKVFARVLCLDQK